MDIEEAKPYASCVLRRVNIKATEERVNRLAELFAGRYNHEGQLIALSESLPYHGLDIMLKPVAIIDSFLRIKKLSIENEIEEAVGRDVPGLVDSVIKDELEKYDNDPDAEQTAEILRKIDNAVYTFAPDLPDLREELIKYVKESVKKESRDVPLGEQIREIGAKLSDQIENFKSFEEDLRAIGISEEEITRTREHMEQKEKRLKTAAIRKYGISEDILNIGGAEEEVYAIFKEGVNEIMLDSPYLADMLESIVNPRIERIPWLRPYLEQNPRIANLLLKGEEDLVETYLGILFSERKSWDSKLRDIETNREAIKIMEEGGINLKSYEDGIGESIFTVKRGGREEIFTVKLGEKDLLMGPSLPYYVHGGYGEFEFLPHILDYPTRFIELYRGEKGEKSTEYDDIVATVPCFVAMEESEGGGKSSLLTVDKLLLCGELSTYSEAARRKIMKSLLNYIKDYSKGCNFRDTLINSRELDYQALHNKLPELTRGVEPYTGRAVKLGLDTHSEVLSKERIRGCSVLK